MFCKCCPRPQLSSLRPDSESQQHFPPCRNDEQRTPKVSLSAVKLFSQSHCRQDLNKPVSSSCHILQRESFTMLNNKPQRRVMVGDEQDGSPKIYRPNDILQNFWCSMALQLGLGELWEEKSSVRYWSDPWDVRKEVDEANTDLETHRAVRYRTNINTKTSRSLATYNHSKAADFVGLHIQKKSRFFPG